MIIFDYNQVAISNLMEQIGYSKTEVQEIDIGVDLIPDENTKIMELID